MTVEPRPGGGTPDPTPNGQTWECEICHQPECSERVQLICAACMPPFPPPPAATPQATSGTEVCGSTGPRIGDQDERPRCAQSLGHEGRHRGFPGSGFESVEWGDPIMRDEEFARSFRPAPSSSPVGDRGLELAGWLATCAADTLAYIEAGHRISHAEPVGDRCLTDCTEAWYVERDTLRAAIADVRALLAAADRGGPT